jgi:hypothetical protein
MITLARTSFLLWRMLALVAGCATSTFRDSKYVGHVAARSSEHEPAGGIVET